MPEHLYSRGFCDGRHSDITVRVFSTTYALHRLILDRSPFFASALSGPWYESSAKEISLHPEDIDPNITQNAFELAMKRLYGAARSEEEKPHATTLLATACWLEMTDLVNTSVNFLMQQMSPAKLSEVIDLVGSNYYGKAGERLLSTAKAMLARDGWQMPLKCWDGISGVLVRQTVGRDGFFVPGEWERWILAKRLYNRRLKMTAIEHGLYGSNSPSRVRNAAGGLGYPSSSVGPGSPPEESNSIKQLYTRTDMVHLIGLLEQDIHYVHMSFEQLQYIRGQVDVLGRPFVRLQTILKAFWMATELRQRVVNSPESTVELGLKQEIEDPPDVATTETDASVTMARCSSVDSDTSQVSDSTRTQTSSSCVAASRHGHHKRFWIPSADSTRVVGDRAELSRETASVPSARDVTQTQQSRRGEASDPFLTHLHDNDRTATSSSRPPAHGTTSPPAEKPPHKHFSIFPPFRFSVEFVSPRVMKDKKRVYSQTVWYAGSMWNVYIQKVQSTKNVQLGVYLHRVRERDGEDMIGSRSVDEAMGQLDREMLMRRQARRVRANHLGDPYFDHGDASGHSGGGDGTGISSHRAGPSGGGSSSSRKAAQKTALAGGGRSGRGLYGLGITNDDMESDDDMDDETLLLTRRLAAGNPAVPPYVDARPTIRTYFKIYQMSPEGKTLSVHKSAPDVFNFSQSWVSFFASTQTHASSSCLLPMSVPVTSRANHCELLGMEECHGREHPRTFKQQRCERPLAARERRPTLIIVGGSSSCCCCCGDRRHDVSCWHAPFAK